MTLSEREILIQQLNGNDQAIKEIMKIVLDLKVNSTLLCNLVFHVFSRQE
jgi:hypothetical protein